MGITTKKIAVIGAGVAGLATAIRLAVAGHQVQVFEKNAYAGGKLSELCFDGFRFDAGPSLFTMPQFLDELFILANRDPRKYYQYHRLEKCCQYFFEDGSTITSQANSDQFEKELANLGVSTNEWKAFQKRTQSIYDITHHVFLEKSIHQWSTYFNWNTIRSIFRLPWIDAHRTMHQANQKFFKSKNAQQLFDRYATYNGSNPFKAPATLNVIQFYEHHFGAYFPAGGMISITNALVQLSKELDVKINFNSEVQEIIGDSRGVQGVRYLQENLENEWLCDQVVSNADLVHTYRKFLPKVKAPERLLKQEKSTSAIIFYWGVRANFPTLDLHNIFFSKSYQEEYTCLQSQKVSHDPTIYLNISCKMEATDAPENAENWFVMINVPHNSGQDWDAIIDQARRSIIAKLSKQLKVDLAALIVAERILDPRSIESRTSAFQGALYGNSSNTMFSAFLRHPNKSRKIPGLFFCGGSVHPGGGIPLALLSGKITANLMSK